MKRQELKDRLIWLADQIENSTTSPWIAGRLETVVKKLDKEGLEGEVRESGPKVTLAKGEKVVPTGNTGRGGVQTHGNGGVVPPDSLSETIAPPWMKDGEVGLKPAFPEGPRMEFPITGTDHEIDIASVCVRALDDLPRESRQRVAHYIAGRFGVE